LSPEKEEVKPKKKRKRQNIFKVKGVDNARDFMTSYFKRDLIPLRQMMNKEKVLAVKRAES
jgi:hypothetical protein